MPNSKVVWSQQQVRSNTDRVVMRNLERAAMFVEGIVIKSISTGQPIRRLRSGHVIGLNPSRPGSPPHVLLGGLRRSITHKVFIAGGQIVALVGSVMAYARRLELGFIGRDARGRDYNQGPRPFLKPAVRNNQAKILSIVTTGKG